MKLLIGTRNQGKLAEYQRLLAEVHVTISGLVDIGLGDLEIEETGTSFEENAALKALGYAQASGLFTLADDTGLSVDSLDGRPGLHSARYGGPELDDAAKRRKLLGELEGVADQDRTARFVCVIAIANPQTKEIITAKAICEGHIMTASRDIGKGFGYDAIFQALGAHHTFAEMTAEQKDQISHRGAATRKIIPLLKKWIQLQD